MSNNGRSIDTMHRTFRDGAKRGWQENFRFGLRLMASRRTTSSKRILSAMMNRTKKAAEAAKHAKNGAERAGSRTQSMSRKGDRLDNGATEQVFGHMKDEFLRDRDTQVICDVPQG